MSGIGEGVMSIIEFKLRLDYGEHNKVRRTSIRLHLAKSFFVRIYLTRVLIGSLHCALNPRDNHVLKALRILYIAKHVPTQRSTRKTHE